MPPFFLKKNKIFFEIVVFQELKRGYSQVRAAENRGVILSKKKIKLLFLAINWVFCKIKSMKKQ